MEVPYIDNTLRNDVIKKKTGKEPTATSTGTTIVGIAYKDGVEIAADTRATAGPNVGDRNCFKLHYLSLNI